MNISISHFPIFGVSRLCKEILARISFWPDEVRNAITFDDVKVETKADPNEPQIIFSGIPNLQQAEMVKNLRCALSIIYGDSDVTTWPEEGPGFYRVVFTFNSIPDGETISKSPVMPAK